MRDVSLSAEKFEDFDEERPAPRRRASQMAPDEPPPRGPRQKRRGRIFGMPRMGVMVLSGIAGLALIGVPMNALFFQDGRHPAPLFSTTALWPEKSEPATAPTPPARPSKLEAAHFDAEAAKPEPAPRAMKSAPRADAVALTAEILKSEAAPAARPEKKREVAKRDAIGALLDGGAPAAVAESPAPDKSVLAAQRALQRLGYVVKPDGVATAATRKAIEKFERDNGLPVTGELGPKVTKLLAATLASQR